MARPKSLTSELNKKKKIIYPVTEEIKHFSELVAKHLNVTEAELHRHMFAMCILFAIREIKKCPELYDELMPNLKITPAELYAQKQKHVLSMICPMLIEILPPPK